MRLTCLVFLLVPIVLFVGCAALQRASDAAFEPSPELDGRKPAIVLANGISQIAAGIATGNIAGATKGGVDIWEALAVIVSAAIGGAGAGGVTASRSTKKAITKAVTAVATAAKPAG